MTAAPAPLRSPPFPATSPDVAAVSIPKATWIARASLTAQEGDRARMIVAAIRAARVGGSFWGGEDADPWHRLSTAGPIGADGDSEYGLLAWIAGCEIDWTGPGRLAALAADGKPDPLERAVTGWLIDGVDYRDPYSGRPIPIEAAIEQLAFWRREIDRNRGIAVATGMAAWKRREVEAMLWPGHAIRFERSAAGAVAHARRRGGAIVNWATRTPPGLIDKARAAGVPIHAIEDGFLRSTGLGSECHPPHSITLDRSGIHLDPSRPCDLETLIATPIDDPRLIARAQQLRRRIVEAGISKYAVGGAGFERPPQARRLALVAGQVENDLSVRLGGAGITSNLELIRRARATEPDAWLLFKPHPDVDAGHRPGKIADAQALVHVDAVIRDVPMASLLDVVDAVHVLTSLTGFEALLRDCEVVVHGQPFYAGWGLTRDLAPPIPRRGGGRGITTDELVASVLILYPRYLDPVTKLPCPPELLAERLAAQPKPRETALTRLRRLQGKLRRGLGAIGILT